MKDFSIVSVKSRSINQSIQIRINFVFQSGSLLAKDVWFFSMHRENGFNSVRPILIQKFVAHFR